MRTATSPKILYVDDEESNCLVFRAGFEEDYNVITCSSGEEALPILEHGDVSVLLADQRMPGMTGLELLTHAAVRSPKTRRVLITADHTYLGKQRPPLVERFILKPYHRNELAAALEVVALECEQVDEARIDFACAEAAAATREQDASRERMLVLDALERT